MKIPIDNSFNNRSKRKNGFNRRKLSLFRKTSELSLISNRKVAVIMINETGQINQFGSEESLKIMTEFINFKGQFDFYHSKNPANKNGEIDPMVIDKRKPKTTDKPFVMVTKSQQFAK